MSIKNENYILIQGWMRTELNLKGNDLLVYAIIYGFSQTDRQAFTGSLQYLADWCGATKQGILKNLSNLIEAGLITKVEELQRTYYYTTEFNAKCDTVKLSLTDKCDTVKLSLINNTINKKYTKKENKIKEEKKPNLSLYERCIHIIDDFTDDEILRELLTHALKLFLENSKESGKSFYTNNFKGKLNILKSLSEDNYTQRKIVKQTLDNGWNGFYELKSRKSNKSSASDMGRTASRMTAEQKKQFKENIANEKLEKF